MSAKIFLISNSLYFRSQRHFVQQMIAQFLVELHALANENVFKVLNKNLATLAFIITVSIFLSPPNHHFIYHLSFRHTLLNDFKTVGIFEVAQILNDVLVLTQ